MNNMSFPLSFRSLVNQLPSGMSAYQADWFVDGDGQWAAEDKDGGDLEEDEEGEAGAMDGKGEGASANAGDGNWDEGDGDEDDTDMGSVLGSEVGSKGLRAGGGTGTGTGGGSAKEMDPETRAQSKGQLREAKRMELLRGDMQFPDEMDTPDDIPARSRFARCGSG